MAEKTEYEILKAQKVAGDELDRLAVEMAAKEGIKYSAAMKRIVVLEPELARQYRTGETGARGAIPQSSKNAGAPLKPGVLMDRALELMKAEPGLVYPEAYKRARIEYEHLRA
jgi:hypothetical protein